MAQTPSPQRPPDPSITVWFVRNWTRAELWRFFEPPAGGGNNDYAYGADRLQLGVRRTTPRVALTAALQYVQFGGLPADAVGPGPLGLGAVYFGHAGRSDSREVYLRYLNLQVKNLPLGFRVQAGRMAHLSGEELPSTEPKIGAVKRQRVDARLVWEFEWSVYQRGYNRVRVDVVRQAWGATLVGFRPTQGGFEDATSATINDITVLGASGRALEPRDSRIRVLGQQRACFAPEGLILRMHSRLHPEIIRLRSSR